ncbi:MAG TPA: hypothetical protein PLQ71_19830 [Nitrospira sp.]|nr:hypothetical protein [Nitrospira sp.]
MTHLYSIKPSLLATLAPLILTTSFNSFADSPQRFDPSGCKNGASDPDNCHQHIKTAQEFWKYAVMAADTYRKIDQITWKRLVANSLTADTTNDSSTTCDTSNRKSPDYNFECEAAERYGDRTFVSKPVENITFDDCNTTSPSGDQQNVAVPILIPDWNRLMDFDKTPTPKGWWVFVPGLFLEVWTREPATRSPDDKPEYAIVFRGTQGGGGWWSNLRFLTSLIPLFHDQYSQADWAFARILDQIAIREQKMSKNQENRPLPHITVVGHSLGAGLAFYSAFRNKGINRIIAFNPSPITGYFREDPTTRAENLESVKQVDVIFENSEILHYINHCNNGEQLDPNVPVTVSCHQLNLSGGSPVSQHEMGPMACKLTAIARQAASNPEVSSNAK